MQKHRIINYINNHYPDFTIQGDEIYYDYNEHIRVRVFHSPCVTISYTTDSFMWTISDVSQYTLDDIEHFRQNGIISSQTDDSWEISANILSIHSSDMLVEIKIDNDEIHTLAHVLIIAKHIDDGISELCD